MGSALCIKENVAKSASDDVSLQQSQQQHSSCYINDDAKLPSHHGASGTDESAGISSATGVSTSTDASSWVPPSFHFDGARRCSVGTEGESDGDADAAQDGRPAAKEAGRSLPSGLVSIHHLARGEHDDQRGGGIARKASRWPSARGSDVGQIVTASSLRRSTHWGATWDGAAALSRHKSSSGLPTLDALGSDVKTAAADDSRRSSTDEEIVWGDDDGCDAPLAHAVESEVRVPMLISALAPSHDLHNAHFEPISPFVSGEDHDEFLQDEDTDVDATTSLPPVAVKKDTPLRLY